MEKVTREDCIRDIKNIAELAEVEGKAFTRRFYREHTTIPEKDYIAHFGTFTEFRRQAGLEISRGQNRIALQTARHASADIYRQMNEERASYVGKYVRPSNGKRYQAILGANDIHDVDADPFFVYCFHETNRRLQPDIVCLNGDIFDLPEFSRFDQDPREWDVVGRIQWVHDFLEQIREDNPDCEIRFVEGNHEYRLLRHLAEATPALRTILSDLHGMSVPQLLGLDKYEVNYVAKADLAAWRETDIKSELRSNWTVMYDAVLACHYPEAKKMGMPGWNGHHHKHLVDTLYSPIYGQYEWHQFGAGHVRAATYCDGEKWSNGFGIWHVDTETKSSVCEYIDIKDIAVIGGQYYRREDIA